MGAPVHIAPKAVRKHLGGKHQQAKRCKCGSVCGEGHYRCSLCVAKGNKKKRLTESAKTANEMQQRRK